MILIVVENMDGYKFGGFAQEFVVKETENIDNTKIDDYNHNNEDLSK